MSELYKFPRTPHIEGSRVQPGDEDLENLPFELIADQPLVITEKLDGANCGISFDQQGQLQLQSRGHFLLGGESERQFDLLKRWAANHANQLRDRLGSRYLVYGEWLYAKHTIFYDRLPHYFFEFDIFDKERQEFLSLSRRQVLLNGLPIRSAPLIKTGRLKRLKELTSLITDSQFISADHLINLRAVCQQRNLDAERAINETDRSLKIEGLYIKVENDEVVTARYKFVRASFHAAVNASGSHWQSRPIIPNQLITNFD